MKKYELIELIISAFLKRWGNNENTAVVVRTGRSIIVKPGINDYYIPEFIINDTEQFNNILERYLNVISSSHIRSTKIDEKHSIKYYLFNIWKNATRYDFSHPEEFISRYINFIEDTTFDEFNERKAVGQVEDSVIYVEKIEEAHGFETPFSFQVTFSSGIEEHKLPLIKYGISEDESGNKVAYIYGIQDLEEPLKSEYDKSLNNRFKEIKHGRHSQRNRAIVALSIMTGFLAKMGFSYIIAPDFLIGRYKRFYTYTSGEPEIIKSEDTSNIIQTNSTERFLNNFIRLEEHFNNLTMDTFGDIDQDSFLCLKIEGEFKSDCPYLEQMYMIGFTNYFKDSLENNFLN